MPQEQSKLSSEQTEKNIAKLAQAVEKTYGSAWNIAWRNFLAGIMRGLGIAFGYAVIVGALILIADKLGMLNAIQNFWQELTGQMEMLSESAQNSQNIFKDFDPAVLKSLPR